MSPPDKNTPPSDFDRLFDPHAVTSDSAAGTVADPTGRRIVYASQALTRAISHVLTRERAGLWREVLARTGRTCGRELASGLDRESTRLGQPTLAELPLESALAFLERTFAAHGLGILQFDLADTPDHGIVAAQLSHSYFVAALPDSNEFVDAYPAGLLQGFFEHISGEPLGCVEVACARRGAPHCRFIITATERLDPLAPLIGHETADAIIARLKA
jgi:predicted hydrocarbon binding protein